MKQFARLLTVFLVLGAMGCPLIASEKTGKDQDKSQAKGKDKSKDKKGSGELNIPIPVGHDAQGVRIPYYDEKGKLQMFFSIIAATRVDEIHLQMKAVNIDTYNPDGSQEMSVEAKSSVLDLNTRIVTSNEPATIRRSDFEITGDTMQFNTKTREGNMSGNVRMLIYQSLDSSEGAGRE